MLTIFLRLKNDGSFRMILNLEQFNGQWNTTISKWTHGNSNKNDETGVFHGLHRY